MKSFTSVKVSFSVPVLISIILILSSFNSYSQNYLGIKGNINWANFSGEVLKNPGDEAYKPYNGFGVGISAGFMFSLNFGMTAELNYNQRGTVFQKISDNINQEKELTLAYAEIPILFRYVVDRIKYLRPNFFIGPQIGFLLTANEDIKDRTPAGEVIRNIKGHDIYDNYSGIDYGIIFGGGINASIGAGYWLNLDARYYMGLADITEDSRADTKSSSFSLHAGFSVYF